VIVSEHWNRLLRGCRVSILGDTRKQSGRGPEQQTVGDPAWARGLDETTFRGPFQPQPFCEKYVCLYTDGIRDWVKQIVNVIQTMS